MDIFLLDADFEIYGKPIDTFSSLTYTDKWSEDGDFKLVLPVDKYNDVKDAKYIYVNGRTFEIATIKTKDLTANGELSLAGHNLNVLLDRVVIETPERIQGNLETEIRALVNQYCGQGWQAIDKFAFETVNGYARAIDANALRGSLGDFLYTELNKRGFSFALTYDITNDQIVFSILQSTDRTQDQTANAYATFSASLGNVENMEYERNETEYFNCAVVCDEDETAPQTAIVDLSNGEPKRTIYVKGSNAYDDTENDALYVMVGTYSGTTGYIATSTDGQTWTNRVTSGIDRLWAIDYQNGRFIACGSNGSIVVSSDGLTWNSKSSGSSQSLEGALYHDGLYMAVGNLANITRSYDGDAWSLLDAVGGKLVSPIRAGDYFTCIGSGGSTFACYRSPDGFSGWEYDTYSLGDDVTNSSVVASEYFNGKMVAVGSITYGGTEYPVSLVSEDDGLTWDQYNITALSGKRFLDIAYGLGVFVTVGQSNLIAWSTDGVSWTEVTPSGGTPDYITVTFDGTLFHAYSYSTKHHAYSSDGKTWTLTTFSTSAAGIDAVIYGAAQRQYSLYSIGYNALQNYKPVTLINGEILPTAHPQIGADCVVGDIVDISDPSRGILASEILAEAQTIYDDKNNGIIVPKFGENYLTLKKFMLKEIKRLV